MMENFEVKIFELLDRGKLQKGDLANLYVQHDGWCKRLQGMGPCNCDPDILVYKAEDAKDWYDTFRLLRSRYQGPKAEV